MGPSKTCVKNDQTDKNCVCVITTDTNINLTFGTHETMAIQYSQELQLRHIILPVPFAMHQK